jgi:hypothetical protein
VFEWNDTSCKEVGFDNDAQISCDRYQTKQAKRPDGKINLCKVQWKSCSLYPVDTEFLTLAGHFSPG